MTLCARAQTRATVIQVEAVGRRFESRIRRKGARISIQCILTDSQHMCEGQWKIVTLATQATVFHNTVIGAQGYSAVATLNTNPVHKIFDGPYQCHMSTVLWNTYYGLTSFRGLPPPYLGQGNRRRRRAALVIVRVQTARAASKQDSHLFDLL